jgi:glycosyltransferase involved in cell wall biosynthesis
MRIVHFLRPVGVGNYSIEGTFSAVRQNASARDTEIELIRLPYANTGFVSRIRNGIYARRRSGDVNHVLGDVHYLVLFLPAKSVLLTVCDCVFAYHPSWMKGLILRLFWLHLPVRRAAIVSAISDKSRREILALTAPPRREVAVVPVCVADCFIHRDKPFDRTCPRILQVGTRPNKNVLRLVRALTGMPVILEIVGPIDASLREALSESGVNHENRTELTEREIVTAYERCDIVAFVSTYEGFGMPIVEGQAVGRVVVTSDLEPMRTVAADGAMLVDPESVGSIRDGILRVIHDDKFRESLIRNGSANAMQYRSGAITAEYLRLYNELGTKS